MSNYTSSITIVSYGSGFGNNPIVYRQARKDSLCREYIITQAARPFVARRHQHQIMALSIDLLDRFCSLHAVSLGNLVFDKDDAAALLLVAHNSQRNASKQKWLD